jgi:transposase
MSAPLPEALRARFQKLIEEGLSGRAAALRLKLSPATGARWGLAIRQTGVARIAPQGRPRWKGKLGQLEGDPGIGPLPLSTQSAILRISLSALR